IIAVHYTGKIVAPWIPRDHSSAITEEEYIGSMALITGHQATSGNPCEGSEDCQLSSFSACWLVFLVLLASCCSMPASWSGNHHCRTCSWFLSVYCLRLLRCIIPVK
ncbi:hypothetical protein CBL20_24955, partial [Shigella flexneri]